MTEDISKDFTIRSAVAGDEHTIFKLICALAEYEKLQHMVKGNADMLREHLFGPRHCVEALLAETEITVGGGNGSTREAVGFALFFTNFSTFLTRPGIYLEDIFVKPEHRGSGIGKALLGKIASLAAERGCGRVEWTVLDWNETAIGFYKRIGADVMLDWRLCRLNSIALEELSLININVTH